MNTCSFVEPPEATKLKSPWVRGILVLGHLAIIVALLAVAHSHRPESRKGVPTGHGILDCLQSEPASSR